MGKRLITEADVRALPAGAELVLTPDVIATPSALDLAFERRLAVVQRDGRPAPARAGAALPGALARMLAQDGTYVVEVRAGRATLTRLTAGGPVAFGTTGGEGG